jgi:hypothetical protein
MGDRIPIGTSSLMLTSSNTVIRLPMKTLDGMLIYMQLISAHMSQMRQLESNGGSSLALHNLLQHREATMVCAHLFRDL